MVQPKAELEEKPTTTTEGFSQKKLFKRFFWLDFIFFFLSAFLGIVILSGAISRVFVEKMAVFG